MLFCTINQTSKEQLTSPESATIASRGSPSQGLTSNPDDQPNAIMAEIYLGHNQQQSLSGLHQPERSTRHKHRFTWLITNNSRSQDYTNPDDQPRTKKCHIVEIYIKRGCSLKEKFLRFKCGILAMGKIANLKVPQVGFVPEDIDCCRCIWHTSLLHLSCRAAWHEKVHSSMNTSWKLLSLHPLQFRFLPPKVVCKLQLKI